MQSFHRPIKILDTFGAAKGGLHLGFRSFRILFTGRTSHSIATATLSVLFITRGGSIGRFNSETIPSPSPLTTAATWLSGGNEPLASYSPNCRK